MTSPTGTSPSGSHAEVPHPSGVRDLKRARLELARSSIAAGEPGAARRRAIADLVQTTLVEHWNHTTGSLDAGVALAAIGGTGRQDAGPCSNLDLVVIHDGETHKAKDVADLAEALWYPLWDAKLDIVHAMRSVSECRQLAAKDLGAATGLLDVRAIAGDASVAQRARAWILADWRANAKKRLPELIAASRARAAQYGELAYLIEPNLKDSRGGLRDAASLTAVAATWLADRPHGRVDEAIQHLLDIRDYIHLASERGANKLERGIADDVARMAGHDGLEDLLAALAESGRTVAYALDTTQRSARRTLEHSKGSSRGRAARQRASAPRFMSVAEALIDVDGEIALAAGAKPTEDPVLSLRAAAVAATTGLAIPTALVESLKECPALPAPWPDEARTRLLELLRSTDNLVTVWEAVDLGGIVATWLPEWQRIRNRPQTNPLHVYTVDRHSLETVVRVGKLARGGAGFDTLLLAALLHDIGKGAGSDHAADGAAMIPDIAARIGLDAATAADVQTLVRHHLLLSDLAAASDVDGVEAVSAVVDALGGRADLLDALRLLSEADATATGPEVWTESRRELVNRLVAAATARLGSASA